MTLSAPTPEDTTIINFRHLLEQHPRPSWQCPMSGSAFGRKRTNYLALTPLHTPSVADAEGTKELPSWI
ncbi:hypothetical protein DBY65_020145 [Pseudomonas sp. RIT412]|nr:hypothetical protein DBP26_014565 [Pseudomonas sp. RIT 409]RAU51404.1 hypothetical protein DBY65_020145 [Pseudomonas sp. RIT 412]